MQSNKTQRTRRQFLQTAAKASAVFSVPMIVPARALGRDGHIAPSERVALAGLGLGPRGNYVLGCFMNEPEVQFVAIAARRCASERKKSTVPAWRCFATFARCLPSRRSMPC